MLKTCISFTLHASYLPLFDHRKFFVNSENHDASHYKNPTRPTLLRPFQAQKRLLCGNIIHFFSIFNFHKKFSEQIFLPQHIRDLL
jgi:hypothetical protein